ncbi:MAG: F420-0--gamma-glutamyl ligase [Firmicutes bacterium ML8_F2]|jgi:hypothetical protein|nr:MAG: F420-0--gamma-glutamyl ligase [Firmicutes bacterium ML8_F2]
MKANPGKKLVLQINGEKYARYPIKTELITPNDRNFPKVIKKYLEGKLRAGDIVFVGEKIIAIMQGRAYPVSEIKPSPMAAWLSRKVYRNPAGIGLASPETMQLAIEEIGLWRILLAGLAALITKPFGIRGIFYLIAGEKARGIDGPVSYAIPPYNTYASKIPKKPGQAAEQISQKINSPVAIVDANDLGVRILGASQGIDKKLLLKALKDNPLGQTDESTPIGVLRKL